MRKSLILGALLLAFAMVGTTNTKTAEIQHPDPVELSPEVVEIQHPDPVELSPIHA